MLRLTIIKVVFIFHWYYIDELLNFVVSLQIQIMQLCSYGVHCFNYTIYYISYYAEYIHCL